MMMMMMIQMKLRLLTNTRQGKKWAFPLSTQGKEKQRWATLKMTQQLSRICDVVELRDSACSVEPKSYSSMHLGWNWEEFWTLLRGSPYFLKTKEKRDVCHDKRTTFTASISGKGSKIVRGALL